MMNEPNTFLNNITLRDDPILLTWNQELSIQEVLFNIGQTLNKKVVLSKSERLGHDKHYRMKPNIEIKNRIKFIDTLKWMITN